MEEMRRVKQYMVWHAGWWDEQVSVVWPSTLAAEQTEGRKAYAHRQAAIRRNIGARCEFVWRHAEECAALADDDDADEPVSTSIEPVDADYDDDDDDED
jgi:hypothetical protein